MIRVCCRYFTLEKVRKRRVQVARTKALMKKKKKSGEEGSDEEMWEEDGDDVASQEDDSAAEDDFLEGLETMQVRFLSSKQCSSKFLHSG